MEYLFLRLRNFSIYGFLIVLVVVMVLVGVGIVFLISIVVLFFDSVVCL